MDEATDGYVTCERCGKRRPADGCGCGGQGPGPIVPEGWDPELTRTSRPRLRLVGSEPPAGDDPS